MERSVILMTDSTGVNREYRDRLFRFIFGRSEKKEWTLSLYNAVNGTCYTDANALTLNTIDDVLYVGMKNDVSFLIGDTMNLYEQQSTFNPNMPMRFLIYAGMLYGKYIQTNEKILVYTVRGSSKRRLQNAFVFITAQSIKKIV